MKISGKIIFKVTLYIFVGAVLAITPVLAAQTHEADDIDFQNQSAYADERVGESDLKLRIPFNVPSRWDNKNPEIPDSIYGFEVEDGQFVPGEGDTWFVYGWFGRIEAILSPNNAQYEAYGGRHNGIDFAGREGLTIVSAYPGEVIFVGENIGNTVIVKTENDYLITYGHLDEITVRVGDNIEYSDLIGTLGNSGTLNPHLHLGLSRYDNQGNLWLINPYEYFDWGGVLIPDAPANRFYEGDILGPNQQTAFRI